MGKHVFVQIIFAHESVYDIFLEKFTNEVKKIKVGNGLEEGVVSGPLIDQSSLEKVIDHVQDAVNVGAKIAVGGEVHPLEVTFINQQFYLMYQLKQKLHLKKHLVQ